MRTFIAVEIPQEIRTKIVKLVDNFKKYDAAVKWVEEENLHFTLKFFGEVSESKLEEICNEIKDKVRGFGKFIIELKGFGYFPRILWVGVGMGSERIIELAGMFEEISYVPHVTIGRIKNKKNFGALKKKIKTLDGINFGTCRVDAVSVICSTLTPKGPIYEEIRRVKL